MSKYSEKVERRRLAEEQAEREEAQRIKAEAQQAREEASRDKAAARLGSVLSEVVIQVKTESDFYQASIDAITPTIEALQAISEIHKLLRPFGKLRGKPHDVWQSLDALRNCAHTKLSVLRDRLMRIKIIQNGGV